MSRQQRLTELLEARDRIDAHLAALDPGRAHNQAPEDWGAAVRAAAARLAPVLAERNHDSTWAQAARLAALDGRHL